MVKIEVGKKYIVRPTREKVMEDRICECVLSSKSEYVFVYENVSFKVEKIKNRLAVTSVEGKDYDPINVNVLEIESNIPEQLHMDIAKDIVPVNYDELIKGIEKHFDIFIILNGSNLRKVQLRQLTAYYNNKCKTAFTTIDIKKCLIYNGFIACGYGNIIKIPKNLHDEIKNKKMGIIREDAKNVPQRDKTKKPSVTVAPVEQKETVIGSISKIITEISVIIGIFKKKIFK